MEFYSNLQTLPKIKPFKTYRLNELEEKYASYFKKIKKAHLKHHSIKKKNGATNFGFITYK